MNNIEYKINKSDENDIIKHFNNCDKFFLETLKNRVNIVEYSKKIFEKATRFEAWNNKDLIGLVAIYLNGENGYVTNLSVSEKTTRQGIASNLFKQCINTLTQLTTIELEVLEGNNAALSFYKKYNFEPIHNKGNIIYMRLKLK